MRVCSWYKRSSFKKHKGCDQATFALRSDQVDEISEYQNARHITSKNALLCLRDGNVIKRGNFLKLGFQWNQKPGFALMTHI